MAASSSCSEINRGGEGLSAGTKPLEEIREDSELMGLSDPHADNTKKEEITNSLNGFIANPIQILSAALKNPG
jgi:hypothetical protein